MGSYHKQMLKKLYGHSDFGPVAATDVFTVTSSALKAVAGHAVVDSMTLPRDTQIKSIAVSSTGVLIQGQVDYVVTYGGNVAASGAILGGQQSELALAGLARQDAAIAASGALLEIAVAVPLDIGNAQVLRLSVCLDYLGLL